MGSKSSLSSLPSTPTASGRDALLDTKEDKNEFSKVSCIQEANNNTEATIIISDDEEEVATQITAETDRNCTDFMSSPTAREVSISDSNVIAFKLNKDQDNSASVMYTTPTKAINVSYKDSVTGENSAVSNPFPRASMNNDNPIETTVIVSD